VVSAVRRGHSEEDLPASADVVVIGAGVMGASIAYQLVRLGAGRVVLVDGRGLGGGNSGRTFGQVRRHYSNELTLRMADRGFDVIQHWRDEVGVGDPGYAPLGYLLLVPKRSVEACRRNVDLARSLGIATEFVTPADVPEIEPLARLDGVAGGAFDPLGGYVDVAKMILSWFAAATSLGLRAALDAAVLHLEARGDRVARVVTSRGAIEAPAVVVAAGTWGAGLVAPLGVEVPLSFVRVSIATLEQRAERPCLRVFLTDAVGELVARPDRGPLAAVVAYEKDAPGRWPTMDPEVDRAYEQHVRRVVAERLPSYADAIWKGAIAGLYDVTPDWHPVLGWAPGIGGLYLAFGFSGHGLKLSPAVGEVVAEEVSGLAPSFDLAPLRLERFAAARPMTLAYGPGARA
jgi:sarcosine oxidase subunit beta